MLRPLPQSRPGNGPGQHKPAPKMATAIQAACCTSAPVCGWSGVVGGVCVLVISVESPSTSEMVV